MNHFQRKHGALCAEDIRLDDLARAYGTPLYVYSTATLTRHWNVLERALKGLPHLVCYAVKANSNLAVLSLFAKLGAGFDIVSAGELFRVVKAGGAPAKVVFSGVGKRDDEIEYALGQGVKVIDVESAEELGRVSIVARRLGKRAPIALRVNPAVDPKTHPYIATGLRESKFGVSVEEAQRLYAVAAKDGALLVKGVAMHIGSQITQVAPFLDAIERVLSLVKDLRGQGIRLGHLDVGGGLGIQYKDEEPPHPDAYGAAVKKALRRFEGEVVDAAMTDLVRPAFYGAHHTIEPVGRPSEEEMVVDVVGPVCESSDFLARRRRMPAVQGGDLLCVRSAGAYGFAMSSNYNARPRSAEVLVDGDVAYLARKRETLDDLVRGESARPPARRFGAPR